MLQYDIESGKMEEQQEAEGKRDVFEQELINHGTEILQSADMDQYTKGDKNLIKFVIGQENLFLASTAKDFVRIEKSFF